MSWEIVYTNRARRDVDRLDISVARRVLRALESLANGDPSDVRKLRGAAGDSRLRVGDWRVILDFDRRGRILNVKRIAHRREAYR